jgi:hypothetical protein
MARGNKRCYGNKVGETSLFCGICRREFTGRTQAVAMHRSDLHMKIQHGIDNPTLVELDLPYKPRRSNDGTMHSRATGVKESIACIDEHERKQGLLE